MIQKKLIIGLVGEIASGKGTVVDYLVNKHNASQHKFSTSLRDLLQRLYLDVNRQNMQNISTVLREHFSQDLLAKVIAEDVANDNNQFIIIDGVRRFSDITYLKKLPEFKLVYVKTDIKKRYERIIERQENTDDQFKTFEQFQKDNQAETEQEILKVAETADYVINNNGTMEELQQRVDEVISNLIPKF
ncbi:MAG: AAA family ATPase [Candidatus Falkowbacteria bacterium]